MAHSLAKVILHIVFSTKNRERLIDEELQPKLHAYLAGACRGIGSEAFRVGGAEDHIHIACTLPRTLSVSKLIEEIKISSSMWLKKQDPTLHSFSWQSGYGAFSIGESLLPTLIHYIDNQREHHKSQSFKDEFVHFLNRYGIECDLQYLWT